MTRDLALLVGDGTPWLSTQEFVGAVQETLGREMRERPQDLP